jgi:hemolysin III
MRRLARDQVSGYTHLVGLVLAALGALVLVVRTERGPSVWMTSAVYAACLMAVYAASSAYHLAPAGEAALARLRKLDHGAIFAMIAGTCTPIFFRAFGGAERVTMLATIWAFALFGIALRALWSGAPRALSTAIYIAMGWLVVVRGPHALSALPAGAVALVFAGGVVYTTGAIVYAAKRPNPVPDVFGFHEIWHLFVLGGSALHYAAIFVLATR